MAFEIRSNPSDLITDTFISLKTVLGIGDRKHENLGQREYNRIVFKFASNFVDNYSVDISMLKKILEYERVQAENGSRYIYGGNRSIDEFVDEKERCDIDPKLDGSTYLRKKANLLGETSKILDKWGQTSSEQEITHNVDTVFMVVHNIYQYGQEYHDLPKHLHFFQQQGRDVFLQSYKSHHK